MLSNLAGRFSRQLIRIAAHKEPHRWQRRYRRVTAKKKIEARGGQNLLPQKRAILRHDCAVRDQ
jgi:hypothetical protein